MEMFDMLKKLCKANGTSGNETDAAKDALKVATHKYKIKRNTAIVYSASALVLSAGIAALARRKRMLQKRQR